MKQQIKKVLELAQIHYSIMTFDDNWKRRDVALWKAVADLNALAGEGLAVGKHLKFCVADGYAHYIVTKVLKNVVHVEHLEYGDNYFASNTVYDDGKGHWCVPRVIAQRCMTAERLFTW